MTDWAILIGYVGAWLLVMRNVALRMLEGLANLPLPEVKP